MKHWPRRAFRGLLLIAWMAVIYHFSDQPNSNQATEEVFGGLNYYVRKGSHLAEYAVLFWLAQWFGSSCEQNMAALKAAGKIIESRRFLPPFLLCFFYALGDEWHQSFVPGRSPLASDVFIDLCGSGFAALASFAFTWLRLKRGPADRRR